MFTLTAICTLVGFAIGFFVIPPLVRVCTPKVLGGRPQYSLGAIVDSHLHPSAHRLPVPERVLQNLQALMRRH